MGNTHTQNKEPIQT